MHSVEAEGLQIEAEKAAFFAHLFHHLSHFMTVWRSCKVQWRGGRTQHSAAGPARVR